MFCVKEINNRSHKFLDVEDPRGYTRPSPIYIDIYISMNLTCSIIENDPKLQELLRKLIQAGYIHTGVAILVLPGQLIYSM